MTAASSSSATPHAAASARPRVSSYGGVQHPDVEAALATGQPHPVGLAPQDLPGAAIAAPDAEAADDLVHPSRPGEEPAETVARIEAGATRLETPCGEGSLVWRAFGDPARPVLLLLHGGFGSWMHWLRNIGPLTRHFRVIALDSPGLGDSASAPEPYGADSLAAIVIEGVRRILPAGEPFHVAGFSFGGLLGGHLAAWAGARCLSYTFIGPGGLGLKRGHHLPLLTWRHVETDAERFALHKENLIRFMLIKEESCDPLAVWIQTRNTEKARTKSRPIASTDTLARKLPLVKARMIGAWGDLDLSAWPYLHLRQELVERTGGEFVIIPEAGHWAMWEQPALVNALIRRNARVR